MFKYSYIGVIMKHFFCKKILISLTLLVLLSLVLTNCDNPSKSKKNEKRDWTIMLYAAADYELIGDPTVPFAENFATNENTHTLILQDNYNQKTKFWYVKPDSSLKLVEDSTEYNMGSESTLSHFVSYTKKHYPADRYILCFYSHGSAWRGCCGDVTDNDMLTNDNIKKGLEESRGVDIVMFTAPCLMGSMEMAYELKDQTEYIIASENTSSYFRWFGALDNLNSCLLNTPDIENKQLCVNIIEWLHQYKYELYDMFDQFDFGDYLLTNDEFINYLEDLTMSAVESDKIGELASALNNISLAYSNRIEHFDSLYTSVFDSLENYSTEISDLLSFIENMKAKERDSEIIDKWNRLKDALANTIIANCHGDNFQYAGGLNIYCPDPKTENYDNYYSHSYYGLDLADDCYYAQLLDDMFQYKSSLSKSPIFNTKNITNINELSIQLDKAFFRSLKKRK